MPVALGGPLPPGNTDNGDGTFSSSDGGVWAYRNGKMVFLANSHADYERKLAEGAPAPAAPADLLGQQQGTSSALQGYDSQISGIDAEIKKQQGILSTAQPYTREWIEANKRLDELTQQRADLAAKRETERQKIDQRDQSDAMQAVIRMREAEARKAPTMDRTIIQETTPDYSRANARIGGSDEFRQRQLSQADYLTSGAGGEGQQALIDRLNADLEGKAPSLAQLQLEEGRDTALRGAASIANSARGNSMGMAQLEALRASQQTMGDSARQAAMLRAQEYAAARGELGTVLSQKRAQELQGHNIAATEYGQGRQQDIGIAGIESQNALSAAQIAQATRLAQANLDQDTKRSNLEAYFRQQGLNDDQARFWAQQYTHYKERPEDIELAKYGVNVQQQNRREDRDQQKSAAQMNAAASLGQQFLQWAKGAASGGGGPAAPPAGSYGSGGGVGGGAPGTPPQRQDNVYEDTTIVDPWKKP